VLSIRMYVESDDSHTKKLYITSIERRDEGTFTCTAQGRRIQLRKSVHLLLFSEHPVVTSLNLTLPVWHGIELSVVL